MLDRVMTHLVGYLLPAAVEYESSESELSNAYAVSSAQPDWKSHALTAKRKAFELAVAIDGMTDRSKHELHRSKPEIRAAIEALSFWPGSSLHRSGCIERVRGVANAYKHSTLRDQTLPVTSEDDILVVGAGWGIDSYGVGKYSGIEVLVLDKNGMHWKFLGDVPVAIAAWLKYLQAQGATLPNQSYQFFGLCLAP